MIPIWITILLVLTVYFFFSFYRTASRLPKGPFPLPFVGNFWNDLHPPYLIDDFKRLAKQFGGVFTVHVPFPLINICSFEVLKEAYSRGEDFAGRIQSSTVDKIQIAPQGGIVIANGEQWKELRRLAISILRDFGMGKNLMEDKIRLSVEEYLRHLKSSKDLDAIDMHIPLQLLVGNIINEFLFGFTHKYDDHEEFFKYVRDVEKLSKDAAESKAFLLCMRFPWLAHVPFFKEYAIDVHKRNMMKMLSYVEREVQRLQATYAEDEEPTNYVHAFLQKRKEGKYMTYENLVQCCNDLFTAGTETTTTTLRWAMLFMAEHLDVQEKIRAEVFAVVGRDRLPSMTDKAKMPYTTAALHEIQRKANIVGLIFTLFHRTTTDTFIEGTNVPEDTMVNVDIHQIHETDPLFVNPEKFWPERYLEKDGKTLKKDLVDRTIPFGYGKRICAGEGLARVELFIGLTATLQNYRVMPTKEGPVNLDAVYSLVMLPKSQKLRLVPV